MAGDSMTIDLNKQPIFKLVVSIAIPLIVGFTASMATTPAIQGWYEKLNSPSFKPPNAIFAPVWTALYIVMGISLFLIWRMPPSKDRNRALQVFAIQLALNFAWSFLFFYFKVMGYALVDIILLWMAIVYMLIRFYRLKRLAAYLNIPYLLWVTFATALNFSFFMLN